MSAARRSGEERDAVVFEAYRRHREELVVLATRRTGDRARAEDLVEEVFLRLLERRRSGRPPRSLSYPFLHTAVLNAARDHLRDEGNRTRLQQERREEVIELSATVPPPDRAIRLTEIRSAVHRAASSLPSRQRQVFELTLAGLSTAEIAVELGITRANVREQRRRARSAVAEILGDEGVV